MEDHYYEEGPLNVSIGEPIFQCTPFAHVVSDCHKRSICDSCFVTLRDPSVTCLNCEHQWYCSETCLQKDRPFHEAECRSALSEKIASVFASGEIKNKLPKFFLSQEDIIEYTQLFFRVLRSSKLSEVDQNATEQQVDEDDSMDVDLDASNDLSSTVTIGDRKRTISWKYIRNALELSEELDESEEVINRYMEEYDNLSEEERNKQDAKLGYQIPDDSFFRDLVIHNEVTAVLNKAIDTVVELSSKTNYFDTYLAPNGENVTIDDMKLSGLTNNNSQEGSRHENSFAFLSSGGTNDRIFNYINNQAKHDNFWKILSALPPEKQLLFFSGCVESLKPEMAENESVRLLRENAANLSRSCDLEIDEETQIESLKMMFRMFKMDTIYADRTNQEKKPLDSQLGFWIIRIKEILQMYDVKGHFGHFEWDQIVKAFFVTLRYSIAIPDVIYNCPIARGVFLPLTLINHSCIPNTAAVFDGPALKLFYMPSSQIKVLPGGTYFKKTTFDSSNDTIFDPKQPDTSPVASIYPYLPLTKQMTLQQLSFDFQYELFSRVESSSLFLFNKIRLIHCECGRCAKTRLFGGGDKVDDEEKNYHDQDMDFFAMDDDYLEDFSAQQPVANDSKIDDYEKCMNIVEQLNAQYGNFLDREYSQKIQLPVNELIYHYRKIFGHHHPKVSVLLLFLAYSNLILIKGQQEAYMIFYRYKLLHAYLVEAIDAFAITHGHDHHYVAVLKSIHSAVHQKLAEFYLVSKEVIDKFDQSASWSEKLFLEMANCNNVKNLNSIVTGIENNELIQSDGSSIVVPSDGEEVGQFQTNATSLYADDNAYNPYLKKRHYSYDEDRLYSSSMEEVDEESINGTCNDMTGIFKLISQICDFSEFRKL